MDPTQGASDVERVCLPFHILAGIKRSQEDTNRLRRTWAKLPLKIIVFCVCMASRGKLGSCRVYQGIFYFLFFFEDVIHSSTERLTPHDAGHPGAICGQGINFFPCVRRPFASCLEAKCVSSEIISERVACSCQSRRRTPRETPISSEVLPVGSGADQFHASLMRNEHSPLARGLSLPWSFLSLAGVCSKPTDRKSTRLNSSHNA